MSVVAIRNQEVTVKEFKGSRVVTFTEIDNLHGTNGAARKNFSANKKRFIEGEDYHKVKPADVTNFPIEVNRAGMTLITESGYLLLVKSFQDDLAWEVQRALVNNYFRVKDLTPAPASALDMVGQQVQAMQAMYAAMVDQSKRLTEVEDKLENTATKRELLDVKRGLIDIDAPLRTEIQELIHEYHLATGKTHRETWHKLYDKLNSRNKVNIQRRHQNRVNRGFSKVTKLDIIEELRLLPDAIRLMKVMVDDVQQIQTALELKQ